MRRGRHVRHGGRSGEHRGRVRRDSEPEERRHRCLNTQVSEFLYTLKNNTVVLTYVICMEAKTIAITGGAFFDSYNICEAAFLLEQHPGPNDLPFAVTTQEAAKTKRLFMVLRVELLVQDWPEPRSSKWVFPPSLIAEAEGIDWESWWGWTKRRVHSPPSSQSGWAAPWSRRPWGAWRFPTRPSTWLQTFNPSLIEEAQVFVRWVELKYENQVL